MGSGAPKRALRFPAFFWPGRGVIHPSFPLRAGGNNLRQPASKPLPPRPPISAGRHSECPRFYPQANERPPCGKLLSNNFFLLFELAMGQNTGRAHRWPRRSQFGRAVPLWECSIARRSRRAFPYVVKRLEFPNHMAGDNSRSQLAARKLINVLQLNLGSIPRLARGCWRQPGFGQPQVFARRLLGLGCREPVLITSVKSFHTEALNWPNLADRAANTPRCSYAGRKVHSETNSEMRLGRFARTH